MYTTDEWGNTVLHIQTGRGGMKLLKESGFNSMDREEYKKHMESYRRLQAKRDEEYQTFIGDLLKLLNKGC